MDPNRTAYLVFSNPADGQDEAYNSWYDEVHVPEVLATPGVVAAQRFDVHRPAGARPPKHRYLAVYEIEGDADAALARINAAITAGAMTMSDTMDIATTTTSFWSPRGGRVVGR